jgi:sugar/nucleoside kinase (ribokinase family)
VAPALEPKDRRPVAGRQQGWIRRRRILPACAHLQAPRGRGQVRQAAAATTARGRRRDLRPALAAAKRLPRLSVDLSSTSAVREYGATRFRDVLAELRPQVVFGTEAEAALVGDVPGCEMVVKLGPRGVRAGGVVHPAQPAHAVDSTGAGDAFAAGYLHITTNRAICLAAGSTVAVICFNSCHGNRCAASPARYSGDASGQQGQFADGGPGFQVRECLRPSASA